MSTTTRKRSRSPDATEVQEKPTPGISFDVDYDGKPFTAIQEGLATVLFPRGAPGEKSAVFYNPIQQFNRDLSVLAIKTFGDIYVAEKRAKQSRSRQSGRKAKETGTSRTAGAELVKQDNSSECAGTESSNAQTSVPSSAEELAPERPQIKFSVLDALSASGLRALRYSLEIPNITSTTANDLDASAVNSIYRNISYNKDHGKSIDPAILSGADAMAKIKVNQGNAQHHMYSVLLASTSETGKRVPSNNGGDKSAPSSRYEVIDLDPYGTAVPFLDAAVQSVSDGGLLCVTCTDAGVWASTGYSEKCFSLYGGLPAKGEWGHEAGLRLILHSIATAAGKYGLSMEPLLSLSIDFYARVFVRIRKSPAQVKNLASTTMVVYNCDSGCGSWTTQMLGKAKETPDKSGKGTFIKYGLPKGPTVGDSCPHCGYTMHVAGPMWGGKMHSPEFINRFLEMLPTQSKDIYCTIPRITGMLRTALDETTLPESPFYHIPSQLSRVLHCEAPPLAGVRGALVGLGYKVAQSHCKPSSLKTNAPQSVMWEVMKKWVEEKPVKEGSLKENSAGYRILQKPRDPALDIKLDEKLGRDRLKDSGIVRYQINPTANWGPLVRATGTGRKTPPPTEETCAKRLKSAAQPDQQ